MAMLYADVSLTFDPAWPWSLPGVGVLALLAAAGALAALTVWTYLSARGITWRRLLAILFLRLTALLIACFLVLRPSLAYVEEGVAVPSKLILVLDYSASMKSADEFDGRTRWDNLQRILESPGAVAAIKKLSGEQRVEIVYYQFAEDLKKFDPEGAANGKSTDMGSMLHELWERHGREPNLRGLVVFSDGADNGIRFPAIDKAAAWRRDYRGACPISVFASGRPTGRSQRDISFDEDKIFSEPSPVPVKGKLTVKAFAHAQGMEGSRVNVSMWLQPVNNPQAKPELVATKKGVPLRLSKDNEIVMQCDAPGVAGEYKATLKIDPLPDEISDQNNSIMTYVTVTKEGVSILWVEGHKRLESTFAIRHALSKDPQFRVYYAEKPKEKDPPPEQADWFDFDKRHYDIIVIGDISAARFAGGNADVFKKMRRMIEKDGTGLMMMGGYEAFGESDWRNVKELVGGGQVEPLLPVQLGKAGGQIEGGTEQKPVTIKLEPTGTGLAYM